MLSKIGLQESEWIGLTAHCSTSEKWAGITINWLGNQSDPAYIRNDSLLRALSTCASGRSRSSSGWWRTYRQSHFAHIFWGFSLVGRKLESKMIGCKIKGLFIIGCKEKLYFTMLELGGYSLRSLSWAKRFLGSMCAGWTACAAWIRFCATALCVFGGKSVKSSDLMNEQWLGFFGDRNTNTGINIDSQVKNKIL